MAWLQAFPIKYPELAVLLLIAIGYVIGASRRKGIGLGPVTGSLFVGVLLGALAGAQTMTAGMAAVQERSESPVAVLGYTPAYPFGHILLTTWGTIVVGLVAA